MDDLLDEDTVLVGFHLVPESDESSDDVSNKSSDDDEKKESDKISIYFCAIWKRSCFFAFSIAALQNVDLQELVTPYSYKRPYSVSSCGLLIRLSSVQDSSWVLRPSSLSCVLIIALL